MAESFEEFKNSFFYGSRSDLSFKFLEEMPDDEAAEFFHHLLIELGDAYDTGSVDRLIDLAYRAQLTAYAPDDEPPRYSYDDRPFSPLAKPLSESRVGLLTSSGHFVDDPRPFGVENMTQREAEDRINEFLRTAPKLAMIPRDTPADDLHVRHGGYDTRSAIRDPNVVFPRDHLVALEAEGRIGELASPLYSFVGAASQGRLRGVLDGWVDQLRDAAIDVLLLVPV